MRITRHFAHIDGRDVHYRRCGAGPALVLLHASPVSSKVFEPAMRIFGKSFTCFAFDTPGNGLSDPLIAEDPDLSAYAAAQADLMSQLGITKAVVYGRHTGASIAVEIARLRPDMVTMVMTDGYPVFTDAQRQAYLSGYLTDLPTSQDGSHALWLWNRYRDQFIFWPWNKRGADTRADCDMPSTQFIHNGVVALMEAGNNYKAPYRAVFTFDALAALAEVTVPVCIAARPGDSLYRKFGDFPDSLWKVDMPRDFAAACAKELEIMSQHMPNMPAPDVQSSPVRTIHPLGPYDVHVKYVAGQGKPVAVIGDVPGCWDAPPKRTQRPVIHVDPLNAGDSGAGPVEAYQQAAIITQPLDQDCDLVGIGAGANIALEVARYRPDAALTLINPLLVEEDVRAACAVQYGVEAAPQRDGTHMVRLWQMLRDEMCWFPHFDQRRQAMRVDAEYDWAALEATFLARLKHAPQLQKAWAAAWSYPLKETLGGVEAKLVFTPASRVPARVHGQPILETVTL
ncbi:MAG: alpha/beta hydrolase [Pseudomonadota bacterium]